MPIGFGKGFGSSGTGTGPVMLESEGTIPYNEDTCTQDVLQNK